MGQISIEISIHLMCNGPNRNRGFVFLNIGDCKAFHWRKKDGKISDMTALNRGNVTDASDPGNPFIHR